MARKATATYQLRVTLRDKAGSPVETPTNVRLAEVVAEAVEKATGFEVRVSATRTDK